MCLGYPLLQIVKKENAFKVNITRKSLKKTIQRLPDERLSDYNRQVIAYHDYDLCSKGRVCSLFYRFLYRRVDNELRPVILHSIRNASSNNKSKR
jgi:hypothetical protein